MRRSAGTVGSLELLAGRARAGDRRAAAQLRKRMTPQVRELARALSADPRAVPTIVRHALHDALDDDRRPYTWALVAAVQRRSAAAGGRAGARHVRTSEKRLLAAIGVLCDMQGHTHSSAAALLGEPVARVADLHAQGRSDLGVDRSRTHCRGWHLVSRLDDLTPPEQTAGRRHLASCRPCEEALAARAAARLRIKAALPVGGTVLGGGIVALFAAVGGGSASVGAAAVGAAAVLGTAGTVAVAVPPAPLPAPPPATVAPAEVAPAEQPAPEPVEDAVVPAPPGPAATELAPTAPEAPIVAGQAGSGRRPTPAPTTPPPPAGGPTLPLPDLPVPTEPPPPTAVPLPEPTASLPLPTSTELPAPRPPLSVKPDKAKDRCEEVEAAEVEAAEVEAAEGPAGDPETRKPSRLCEEELRLLPAATDEAEHPGRGLLRLRDLREPRPDVSRNGQPLPQPAR